MSRFLILLTILGAALTPTAMASEPGIDLAGELRCLALNIYFEARGEPDLGKRAVGHVVINRASDPRFPARLCDVVQQGGMRVRHRCQFSWWCDGRSDRPEDQTAWTESQALARRILWGRSLDPTSGALWYHARRARPSWRNALVRGPSIGRHIFYLAERDT